LPNAVAPSPLEKTLSDFASGGCLMDEMHEKSDAQLLRGYAQHGDEAAFREIVTRHTDLVYSVAVRCVNSPDLACDIAQSVFTDLSSKARPLAEKLAEDASLVGWLYRSTRFAALNQLRSDHRRLSHERQAMEQLLSDSETAPGWDRIRPVLDEAMDNLSDEDRDALLLRYFKNHAFRDVGLALGLSDDAAQKRVSRAVERLREFFNKRGITVGASGLVVVISANAVQAAPVGLAVAISTAAAITGTTIATTATATAIKTIAMTTLQKTIIGATLAAAVGTGVYEARQTATFHAQVQTLQQQQAPLTEQIQQLRQERDDATSRVAQLTSEVERLNQGASEVIKLRGEVARLRNVPATQASQKAGRSGISQSDSATGNGNVSQLTQEATQLWQSGRYAEAISKFESALKVDPNNSIAWNGLGWASFNSGKPAEAEQAFQKVIESEPEHPAALNGLGQLYLSQKKYAEAEPYLLKASPTASAAWFGLARLYLLQDKFEEAEKWAQAIDDSGQGSEFSRAMLKAAKDKKVSNALRLGIEPK